MCLFGERIRGETVRAGACVAGIDWMKRGVLSRERRVLMGWRGRYTGEFWRVIWIPMSGTARKRAEAVGGHGLGRFVRVVV